MITYDNAHATNPFYRSDLEGKHPLDIANAVIWFQFAIAAQYVALNARRAAQYEEELVPLSKNSSVLIPQYCLPLGRG